MSADACNLREALSVILATRPSTSALSSAAMATRTKNPGRGSWREKRLWEDVITTDSRIYANGHKHFESSGSNNTKERAFFGELSSLCRDLQCTADELSSRIGLSQLTAGWPAEDQVRAAAGLSFDVVVVMLSGVTCNHEVH